jgi:mono/diheme cytochrome c family protein
VRRLREDHALKRLVVVIAMLLPALAAAQSNAPPPASRGQLLYDTHCIACHNEQVHWRDRKLVKDWPTLVAEVRRWQEAARLGWKEPDIDQVSRYLNETIYKYEAPRATAMR